jgi:hypothetical protein
MLLPDSIWVLCKPEEQLTFMLLYHLYARLLELDVVALFNSAMALIFSLKQGKWLAISLFEREIL